MTFMLIAGEASGDLLAAELVRAIRGSSTGMEPRFFGAGRQQMAAAGVELAVDMTAFGVVGISDVLKRVLPIRRAFRHLLALAVERQPDVIIGVDYGGFNLRFAAAVRRHVAAHSGAFSNWRPKLVQFVSPQVWASRAGRAWKMERDLDLLLSIFPFEKAWYAERVPKLSVEFVGHPMLDRLKPVKPGPPTADSLPTLLLLPGSRAGELRRHLPALLGALKIIRAKLPSLRAETVLPDEAMLAQAKALGLPDDLVVNVGGLADAFRRATVAIASTGTVTMECAFSGVPTVTLYKTSWSTYQIAKRLVKVKSLTMPNLLAGEEVFPEFIQDAATPENLAGAAFPLLSDSARRAAVASKLKRIVASLGESGAARRAAEAIMRL